MAGVRDPAFWRRFSMAVHLDEEKAHPPISDTTSTSTATSKRRPKPLEHTDSWLERTHQKQRRTRICGWFILFVFMLVIAGIVMALMWVCRVGPFKHLQPLKIG